MDREIKIRMYLFKVGKLHCKTSCKTKTLKKDLLIISMDGSTTELVTALGRPVSKSVFCFEIWSRKT